MCNDTIMKKITHLDMSAIMADYTAKVIAEAKAADARREAYRKGEAKPIPTTVWDISDRH
jgi:hypothetical protein